MLKNILLGSVATLVAVTGAQAADLPVKTKPVQYVKICSLYGAGFYYIPGTDTCLKVGGWVRAYIDIGSNGNVINGALGSGNLNTRSSNNGWNWKSRAYITADARTQTEWGTLRSYIAIGESTQGSAGASNFNSNRAFIQLAGFTFGVAQSFYDILPTSPVTSYFGGLANPSSYTADTGQTVTAYTAQFGGGFSATISAEAPRTTTVVGPTSFLSLGGGGAGFSNQAISVRYPDILANLRLDAAWGAAQIMGAIHDASGLYYGATTATGGPSNATGWAMGAGIILNTPMVGPGDYFSAQINYANGASGYAIAGASNGTQSVPGVGGFYSAYNGGAGGSYGFGVISDGVYAPGGSIQLTTTWGVNAVYEHFWSKRWQTSIYGAYIASSYNAVANAELCALEVASLAGASPACNNNWSYWDIGSRTQFNVDSQTFVGVDIIYTKLNTASNGVSGFTIAGSGTQPAAVRTLADQSAWMAELRVQRSFYP